MVLHLTVSTKYSLFEATCTSCTVGSYAPFSVCPSGFVKTTLCSTSTVQDYVVQINACHIGKSHCGLTANAKLHFAPFSVVLE